MNTFTETSTASGEAGASSNIVDWVVGTFRAILFLFLSLVATLPWGISEAVAFAMPISLAGLLVHLHLRHGWSIPSPIVFLGGLALDALTNSPLGFWPLIFLAAMGLAPRFGASEGLYAVLRSFWWGSVILALAGGFAWGLASLFYGELAPYQSMLSGTAMALIGAPLLAWAVSGLEQAFIRSPMTRLMAEA